MSAHAWIERSTKFAAVVDELPEAWAFVMTHIDQLGERPMIHIEPYDCEHEDGIVTHWGVEVSTRVESPLPESGAGHNA